MLTYHRNQLVQFHAQSPNFIAEGRVLEVFLGVEREYGPGVEDLVVVAWQNGAVSAVPSWNGRLRPVTNPRILAPGFDLSSLPDYFEEQPTKNVRDAEVAQRDLLRLHQRLVGARRAA